MGSPDRSHRLPRPRSNWLRIRLAGSSEGSRARPRGSVSGAVRHCASRWSDTGGAQRQRLDLPEPAVPRAACRDYRLRQEFITPYTHEQNGIVERFFRNLKEECVWQHNFGDFAEARTTITKWIKWYNAGRPHQSLGYRSPRQFRGLQYPLVAYSRGAPIRP